MTTQHAAILTVKQFSFFSKSKIILKQIQLYTRNIFFMCKGPRHIQGYIPQERDNYEKLKLLDFDTCLVTQL